MSDKHSDGSDAISYSMSVKVNDETRGAVAKAVHDRIHAALAKVSLAKDGQKMSGSEPHMAIVDMEVDVLVAGGGMAGVCAAIASARSGARTVLVQDRSRLGGNSSSEISMHIVGANWHKNRPGWREGGLLEEFRLDDAVGNPHRCFELWDLLLYDKVISEPQLTLLLDSVIFSCEVEDGRIRSVLARCDKTEQIYRIGAKIFCDCTGDSRLALEAGAEMRRGRESRAEFDESFGPETADAETLGSSILFTSRRHEAPVKFKPPLWARQIGKEQLRARTIRSWEYGYWWIEWGGSNDTVASNEMIRFELLSIVMGVWNYIKNSGEFPDSANYSLEWVGMLPGKRESRRVLGDHVLTEHDLLSGGPFEDAVAIGGWPMDDHPPGGFDRSGEAPGSQITCPIYNIPLRSLFSRNIANLMMAGRNISASHAAFTSARVMGTCSAIGQATGTAAAVCAQQNTTPREIYRDKVLLAALQQRLLRNDQTIKGLANADHLDLACSAQITASNELEGSQAALIIDGYTRNIPPPPNPEPEQDVPLQDANVSSQNDESKIHQWTAVMEAGGAWIELAWKEPQSISKVQITFDTGFQRELTLTASDSINRGIIRAPQPETVRDYEISYRPAEGLQLIPLLAVTENHQRINRLEFEPILVEALRIHVSATNGDACARIFEVRCYT